MKTFTLEEVQAAFRRLEDHVAKAGVDADCLWAIHYAAEDVIRILSGEWEPEGDEPAEDELRRAALEAWTAEAFDAAIVHLLGAFDERQSVTKTRDEIDSAWRPSPMGNEAMLEALAVYDEKRTGALGRGAARSEADVFALMEARRVYKRQIKGGS